jgi:hypothetical protein
MKAETIRIKPSHPSQGDFVTINKADFNPAIHEAFDHVPNKESKDTEAAETQVKRGRKPKGLEDSEV